MLQLKRCTSKQEIIYDDAFNVVLEKRVMLTDRGEWISRKSQLEGRKQQMWPNV